MGGILSSSYGEKKSTYETGYSGGNYSINGDLRGREAELEIKARGVEGIQEALYRGGKGMELWKGLNCW